MLEELGLPDKPHYRVPEIAQALDISDTTVYNWIREGTLRARRVGKLLRVPQEALVQFLQESEVQSPTR